MPKKKFNPDVIAAYVASKFSQWSAARQALEDKWDRAYRTWRCLEDSNDKTRNTERSQIKIPATKEAINNAVDAVCQVIFASDPFFRIAPQQLSDAPRAEQLGQFLNWLFQKQSLEQKLTSGILEMCRDGTIIGRIVPRPRTDSRIVEQQTAEPVPDPITGEIVMVPGARTKERVERTRIFPEFETVSIYNFYTNPTATSPQDAEGCIVRRVMKSYELLEWKRSGVISALPPDDGRLQEGDDLVVSYGSGAPVIDTIRDRLSNLGIAVQPSPFDVEVLEWWGFIPSEVLNEAGYPGEQMDGGAEMVVYVANKNFVMNPDTLPNPFFSGQRPFLKATFEESPGEFYGIGIPEISDGPQRALDATVRQRIDNKAIAINQMFAANARKLTPGQNMSVYPGKIFLTEGPPEEVMKQFIVQDVTQGSYIDAQEYERYIQSAHGISRVVGGQPGKQERQTATEVSILVNQSSTRIKSIVKRFEDSFIEPLLRWYTRIVLQYIEAPEIFRVVDPITGATTLQTMDPTDVTDDVDFIPQGSIALAQSTSVQALSQFAGLVANPMLAPMVNWPYLIRELYKSITRRSDADLVLNPNPIPAAQMLAGQPAGAGQPGAPSQPAPEQSSAQPSEMMTTPEGTANPEMAVTGAMQ